MSQTLYRKYRPQCFADLTGQNHIKVTLQNEIIMGRLAHAYLFTGPRGVGKTTTARILAKAINCMSRGESESEPCNTCEACLSITEGRALDVIEMDAASHTGVDNVRENIIENARFTPNRLKYKVFIIDEVHMLSTAAWNALLKTLEEPPAHALLILATTEMTKIPQTITSRCQRFDFHRISANLLVERLQTMSKNEGVEVEREVLFTIARAADGGLRDAESMLGQVLSLGEKKVTLDLASIVLPYSAFESVLGFYDILARKAGAEALQEIARITDEGVDPKNFLDELIDFGRKLLLSKYSGSLQEFTVGFDTTYAGQILDLVKQFESPELIFLLDRLIAAREGMNRAKIPQLGIEVAVVEFCEQIKPVQASAPPPNIKPPQTSRAKEEKKIAEIPPQEISPPKDFDGELSRTADAPLAQNLNSTLSLEDIIAKWPEFVRRVQLEAHSLTVTLSVATPAAILNNELQMTVSYKFHADRLNEIKNSAILERVAAEVYGTPLTVTAVIREELPGKAEPLIKKALEALGGRVLE